MAGRVRDFSFGAPGRGRALAAGCTTKVTLRSVQPEIALQWPYQPSPPS